MSIEKIICLELPFFFKEKPEFFHKISLRPIVNPRIAVRKEIFFEIIFDSIQPYFKPWVGETGQTSNFLIKIDRKKSTNIIKSGKFFFKINKVIKIRKFADFQYIPFCENLLSENIKPRQEVARVLKKMSIKNKSKYDFPIDFLLPQSILCLKYRKNFIVEERGERERKKKNCKKKKFLSF